MRKTHSRLLACTAVAAVASACVDAHAPVASARAWPAADALFRGDARFLGADSAYSTPLGDGRVLWLFGDTFVALDDTRSRRAAKMVRNSVAVQTGTDPSTARIAYFFGGTTAAPAAFLDDPESTDASARWRWPGAAVLVEGKLLVFLWDMARTDGGLGFALEHTSAVLVDNPADDPPAWRETAVEVPSPARFHGAALGTGGALVDGGFLWLLATREPGDHAMVLARVPADDAARGDLSRTVLVGDAGFAGQTELSLTHARGAFQIVSVDGFGDAPVTVRTSSTLPGTFSAPAVIFRAPEAAIAGAFVYSAKAHPELTGADLVVTYCSNDTDFSTLLDNNSLYFPRFVRVTLAPQ